MLIDKCPVCGSHSFEPFLTCKDHTVSKQDFHIVSCKACSFKFTNPRPDDSEIGNYYKSEDYVSHSNTKKGLINKLYHAVRSHTLKKKLALIETYVSRGTILDYGCGTGMFLNTCHEADWKCFGYEPDNEARKIAEQYAVRVSNSKADLQQSLGDYKLDIITLWHVMEHVTDVDQTLRFFRDNLSDTGTLIIAVPNHVSHDGQFYKEHWAGYDVPRHLYHFELKTMEKLLSNYGFKLEDTKPMKFDSYYVSMLSEKYKTGSMNYLKAFLRGFISNQKAKRASDYSSVIYVFKQA